MEHWGEGFQILSHPPLLLHRVSLVLIKIGSEVASHGAKLLVFVDGTSPWSIMHAGHVHQWHRWHSLCGS